ncbi:hypothetical protein FRC05_004465 [Tulasnella sp. 425]|nr:hypothetical protein FRC05_004465 [Tulasnella sp. 425]
MYLNRILAEDKQGFHLTASAPLTLPGIVTSLEDVKPATSPYPETTSGLSDEEPTGAEPTPQPDFGSGEGVAAAFVPLPPSRPASPYAKEISDQGEEEVLQASFIPLPDSRPGSPEFHALDPSTRNSDLYQHIATLSRQYIILRAMVVRPISPEEARAIGRSCDHAEAEPEAQEEEEVVVEEEVEQKQEQEERGEVEEDLEMDSYTKNQGVARPNRPEAEFNEAEPDKEQGHLISHKKSISPAPGDGNIQSSLHFSVRLIEASRTAFQSVTRSGERE